VVLFAYKVEYVRQWFDGVGHPLEGSLFYRAKIEEELREMNEETTPRESIEDFLELSKHQVVPPMPLGT